MPEPPMHDYTVWATRLLASGCVVSEVACATPFRTSTSSGGRSATRACGLMSLVGVALGVRRRQSDASGWSLCTEHTGNDWACLLSRDGNAA